MVMSEWATVTAVTTITIRTDTFILITATASTKSAVAAATAASAATTTALVLCSIATLSTTQSYWHVAFEVLGGSLQAFEEIHDNGFIFCRVGTDVCGSLAW